MKIDYLKINGFSKFQNKEIEFKDKINIVYGENESGKSSLLKFISTMIYGASRNKNGKDIPDFDRFKPWDKDEYSGKIKYTLDNTKTYEVFREFKKKNPVVYNEKMENITKEFNATVKGIDFFTEQTKVDEETFFNTAIIEQEGMKLNNVSQTSIIQKISNLVSSGDDNISYKKSIEKIKIMQNEQVGTDRTSERPMNIVENRIKGLKNKKKELETYTNNEKENAYSKEKLIDELKLEEIKKELLKEIKEKLDNNRIKNAEINLNINLENDYNKKIEELNNKINTQKGSKSIKPIYFYLLGIFIIALICSYIFSKNTLFSSASTVPIIAIILLMLNNKKSNSNIEAKDTYKIQNEIKILKETKEKQKKEVEEKQFKLEKETENHNRELIKKYNEFIEIAYLEMNVHKNYDNILKELDENENRTSNLKLKIKMIENEAKNINNNLDNLAKIEEELQELEKEKEELISLNNSFNIARECLEEAYIQMKDNVSPKFTNNLCKIISNISDGKYTKINFDDNQGLSVEIENGNYMPISRLSVGTIDQMYIALRLSALDEISNETMPIILDEAFVYFDNERLKNILKYINENYKNNQIIIFTCSGREKIALDELNVKYNLLNLL